MLARVHASEQIGQRADQRAPTGSASTSQRCDVGDVLALLLAEADQAAALLRDVARRQPRAPAIVPVRTSTSGGSHSTGCDIADALEVLRELFLFGLELRGRIEVLQRAAAAHHRSARSCGVTRAARGLEHLDELGLVVALVESCARRKLTRSPGNAPATNTVLPEVSLRAHHAFGLRA